MMVSGIRCFDSKRRVTLSMTDRLTRVLDIINIPFQPGYEVTFVSDEFINHDPFVHLCTFNDMISAVIEWKYGSPYATTESVYGRNTYLNATYFQLGYERVSPNSIKITTRFFYGRKNTGGGNQWITPDPSFFTQIPIKVIIGVY